MTSAKKSNEGAEYEMTTTRFLGAPRELVFKAWTDPKLLAQWWGPNGFTTTMKEWFPKAGGSILLNMNAPNGTVYPMGGKFVEVKPPETVVFESAALDPEGKAIFEVLNSITLAEEGKGTRLTIHAKVLRMRPEARQYLNGQKVGWSQSLDRLEAFVTKRKP
jgi:uncharacterized protein YndB with AHSA1/START domain